MASELSPCRIEGNLRLQWPNVIDEYLSKLDRDRYKAFNLAAINLKTSRDTIVNWVSGATFTDTATFIFALHKMDKEITLHPTYGALIIDKDSTVSVSQSSEKIKLQGA